MFQSIWEDIKWKYQTGNTLIRIIMVNVAAFVFINLGVILIRNIIGEGAGEVFLRFFMVSSDLFHDFTHPWVFITHMFLHTSFWHIFWNMVWLYTFGNIIGDLLSDRVVLPTYILSGLFGALIYVIAGNTPTPWDVGGFALGASAAVCGFLMLGATRFPDYVVNLFFIGPIKLKFIFLFFLLVDLFALGGNTNSGGHLAHLGGVFMGWYLAEKNMGLIDSMNGIIDKVNNFFTKLFSPSSKSKMKVRYKNTKKEKQQHRQSSHSNRKQKPEQKMGHQEKIDAILDKIKESGYESLNEEEKEYLNIASKKK